MHWLNLAYRLPLTEAEGPGRRAAVWVQGCNKRCIGCCNPGYLQLTERDFVSAESVLDWLENAHKTYDLEGVTFLGGEPMLQAKGLAHLAEGAQTLGLSVMVFSGYTIEELSYLDLPGYKELLLHTDILVDGPYESKLQDHERRWVGSKNQKFHYLTDRYTCEIEKEGQVDRALEVHFNSSGNIFINGWPEKIIV